MSAFSKKYYSPKDPSKFLSVTWETGYRDIQIFYEGRLVHEISEPGVLLNGITIKDDELGTLKIEFTIERPRKLQIKVNNKKYKTVNRLNLRYDYTGLITIFTTLAAFAGIEAGMYGGRYNFDFTHPELKFIFTVNSIIIVIYIATSYLMGKKKPWSYFMGTSVFTFTTIIVTLYSILESVYLIDAISLVARYAMFIYVWIQVKHITKEMTLNRKKLKDTELIDSV